MGHVLRMPRERRCATALTWTPMGKRKVGCPKTTWRRTVEKERTMACWKSWEEARARAKDREKWKTSIVQPYLQQSAKGIGEVICKKW